MFSFDSREDLKYQLRYLCWDNLFGEFGDWTPEPKYCTASFMYVRFRLNVNSSYKKAQLSSVAWWSVHAEEKS
jgi:hypothetical protein